MGQDNQTYLHNFSCMARQGSAHGRVLHRSASQKAGAAWRSAGEGASRLWKGAGPTAHGYILAAQVAICLESADCSLT